MGFGVVLGLCVWSVSLGSGMVLFFWSRPPDGQDGSELTVRFRVWSLGFSLHH